MHGSFVGFVRLSYTHLSIAVVRADAPEGDGAEELPSTSLHIVTSHIRGQRR